MCLSVSIFICFLYTGRYRKLDLNLNKTAYLNKTFALEYKVADKATMCFLT